MIDVSFWLAGSALLSLGLWLTGMEFAPRGRFDRPRRRGPWR